MPKLTKRVIDAMEPPTDLPELYAWDSELKGFGVRLLRSGVGTYILKYRVPDGRQRKLALGRVGTLTPDEARVLARQQLSHEAVALIVRKYGGQIGRADLSPEGLHLAPHALE